MFGINADKWERNELSEVISSGEALLNISFSEKFKGDLLDKCLDNVYIVQETCYQACVKEGVSSTRSAHTEIGNSLNVEEIIKEVVNQQTGRYNSFITQFAAGFQDTTLQMHKWILYPVITASKAELESGLRYRQLRDVLRRRHPEGVNLNQGNLTNALQSTASLQVKKDIKPIVLDYDQTNLRLNVVDRGFVIWLQNQERNEILDLAELPTT
jgi:hypothetical protein